MCKTLLLRTLAYLFVGLTLYYVPFLVAALGFNDPVIKLVACALLIVLYWRLRFFQVVTRLF